jgi:hypothetical protein
MRKPIPELTREDVAGMSPSQRAILNARCMTAAYLPLIDSLGLSEATKADEARAGDLAYKTAARFEREFNIWFRDGIFTETVSGASQEAAYSDKVVFEEDVRDALSSKALQKLSQYGLRLGFERASGSGAKLPIFAAKDEIKFHPLESKGDGKFIARFDVTARGDKTKVLTSGTMPFTLAPDPYGSTAKTMHFTGFEIPAGKMERVDMRFPGLTSFGWEIGDARDRKETGLINAEMRRRGWLI